MNILSLKKNLYFALLVGANFITSPIYANPELEPVVYLFKNFMTTNPVSVIPRSSAVAKIEGKFGGGSVGDPLSFTAIKLSDTSYLAQVETGIYKAGVFFSITSDGKIKVTHARYCLLSKCKNRNLTWLDMAWHIATNHQSLGYGIFDLKITELSNFALHKSARQSSTHSHSVNPVASKAVDGNMDGFFPNGSVTHTSSEGGAWWQVDLGSAKQIQQIHIFNRTDCCNERLSNYRFVISNDATLHDVVYQKVFSNYPDPKQVVDLGIQHIQGRYVSIQLLGGNVLSLAEVKVLGFQYK